MVKVKNPLFFYTYIPVPGYAFPAKILKGGAFYVKPPFNRSKYRECSHDLGEPRESISIGVRLCLKLKK